MRSLTLGTLSLMGLSTALGHTVALSARQGETNVNGTAEYFTNCKKCPYIMCTNPELVYSGTVLPLTCWTYGDLVGDSQLWLKTNTGCFVSEYDLIEHEGDYREEIPGCGDIPFEITEQPARVRYLSECKESSSTSSESTTYYGRDLDLTVLCWAQNDIVNNNPYWYKTTDNCYVSESGLWEAPDRSKIEHCGPKSDLEDAEPVGDPAPVPEENGAEGGNSLAKRWLEEGKIGEEYSYCLTCPSSVNATCEVVKTYEYNQTVLNQCTYGNDEGRWMLTVDWCYVNGTDFWVPPWDHYRYPSCEQWGYPLLD